MVDSKMNEVEKQCFSGAVFYYKLESTRNYMVEINSDDEEIVVRYFNAINNSPEKQEEINKKVAARFN